MNGGHQPKAGGLNRSNPPGKSKKRKIMLVIEDGDMPDQFSFTVQGDTERFGSTEMGLVPSAAEFWALEFYKLCKARLDGEAKLLNRKERREGVPNV